MNTFAYRALEAFVWRNEECDSWMRRMESRETVGMFTEAESAQTITEIHRYCSENGYEGYDFTPFQYEDTDRWMVHGKFIPQ